MLKIGDEAPNFTLPTDEDGKSVTLSDLRGHKVLIYFYPKDDTPGCTKQACDFRDRYQQFLKKDVYVLGISRDSVNAHRKFKTKYGLTFPLLVDADGQVCEAYNVINKKNLFGNTFLGITRSTFLIDEKGHIQAIWRKVKVPGHVEQLLNEI